MGPGGRHLSGRASPAQPLYGCRVGTHRHAYLITAADNFYVLERLLGMLDDPRNDIFVHVDAKTREVDIEGLTAKCRRSTVTFVPRLKVYWGDFSQVRACMRLLRVASEGAYSYYHLLSGSDLPLKTQDEIHEFFDDHAGTEFIHFAPVQHPEWVEKVHLRNRFPFLNRGRMISAARSRCRRVVSGALTAGRRLWPGRPQLELKYGSDWWSISRPMALHLLASEQLVERLLRRAFIPTEFYVQTIAWNSRHRDRLSAPSLGNMRLIDWSRPSTSNGSSPHVWRCQDMPALMQSECLFARKFLADIDKDVVDELYARLAPPRHSRA